MKNKITFILILGLLVLPLVSTDVIMPGTKVISVTNQITNINDFPDYVFISASTEGPGLGMCEVKVVGSNGFILPYYKFCDISIYAIAESDFDQALIDRINNETRYNYELALELFETIPKTEVISGIRTFGAVPESSAIGQINNFYTIDLEQVKTEPDRRESKTNYLEFALYLLVSLVALILIIIILLRRKK